MAKSFFKDLKEGMKEGANDIINQTLEEGSKERQEKSDAKYQKKQEQEIKSIPKEAQIVLGSEEKILYAFTFWNDKMIVTNKKLIYIDTKIAKNKTFAMIPFNKITSYALLVPTGLSAKGKLKIFTGGDSPAIEIESVLNEGMNEFCTILADII